MKVISVFKNSQVFYSYPYHTHKNWELIYSYEGKGHILIDGYLHSFQEGTVIMVPPGIPHQKIASGGYRDLCIQFADPGPVVSQSLITEDPDGVVHPLCEFLYEFHLKKELTRQAEILEHMMNVLFLFLTDLASATPDYNSAVKDFEDILIQHFHESDFDLPQAIRNTGFSTNYFRTQFHHHTGMTPLEYLEWLRISYAKDLLRHNEAGLNIFSIAALAGYSDPYYFSRVFKKREGISPRYYRDHNASIEYSSADLPIDTNAEDFFARWKDMHEIHVLNN